MPLNLLIICIRIHFCPLSFHLKPCTCKNVFYEIHRSTQTKLNPTAKGSYETRDNQQLIVLMPWLLIAWLLINLIIIKNRKILGCL
jgi:hypothetical protein